MIINSDNLINIFPLPLRTNGKTGTKKCVNKEREIDFTFLGLIGNKDHEVGGAFRRLKYIVSFVVR